MMTAARKPEHMGEFEKLVHTRGPGIPTPHAGAYHQLVEAIRTDQQVPTMGRRAVLWVVMRSRFATAMMTCFKHREWGAAVAQEIQYAADHVSNKHRELFLACDTGIHLTHHCGGLDDFGQFTPRYPANTLWMAEGDDFYPKPGPRKHPYTDLMIIEPRLSEIGAISLESKL